MTDQEHEPPLLWWKALAAILIWRPDIWALHANPKRRAQLQLHYRCRGIVAHDRILNGRNP